MQWGDIDEQLVGYSMGNDSHTGSVAAFKKRSQRLGEIFCAQPAAWVDQCTVDPDGIITPLEALTLQLFKLTMRFSGSALQRGNLLIKVLIEVSLLEAPFDGFAATERDSCKEEGDEGQIAEGGEHFISR